MKRFEDLTFADRYMFEKVLQDKDICKELLERLLKIKIERLEYPKIDKELSHFYNNHGVRIIVYVKDSDTVFDIELQNSTDTNIPLLTRYYQAMHDFDNMLKGQYYFELPPSYLIFICTYDPFKHNFPVYSFSNRCIENKSLILDDEVTKLIFNATSYEKEDDIEIKSFLEYVHTNKPVDDFTGRIDSLVFRIKQQEDNKLEYESMDIHDEE